MAGGSGPYTATADSYPPTPEITVESLAVNAGTVSASAFASCQAAAPNAPSFRIYPAVLRITDSAGRVASAVFPINVSNNELPTLGAYSNQTIANGNSAVANPAVAPADPNGNFFGMTVSPATLPGGGTLIVDQMTGAVTIQTTAGTVQGTYPVRVHADDSCGARATRQFDVTVSDVLFANGFE